MYTKITTVVGWLAMACLSFGGTVVLQDDFSFGSGDRSAIADGDLVEGTLIQDGDVAWSKAQWARPMEFHQTAGGDQVMAGVVGKGGGQMSVPFDAGSVSGIMTASVNAKLTDMMKNAYTPGFSISFTTATSDLSVNAKTADSLSMRFDPFSGVIQVRTGYAADSTENPVLIGSSTFANYNSNNVVNLSLSYNTISGEINATVTDTVTDESAAFTQTLSVSDFLIITNMDTVALEVTTFNNPYTGSTPAYFDDFEVSVAYMDTTFLQDNFSFGSGERSAVTNGSLVDGTTLQYGHVAWETAHGARPMQFFETTGGKQVMAGIPGKSGGQMAVPYNFGSVTGLVSASVDAKLTDMVKDAWTPGFSISFTTATDALSVSAKTADSLSMRFNPFTGLVQVRTGYSEDSTVSPVMIGGGTFENYNSNNIVKLKLSYAADSGEIIATVSDTVTGDSYTYTKTLAETNQLNLANMNTVALEMTTFDSTYTGSEPAYFDDFQVQIPGSIINPRIVSMEMASDSLLKLVVALDGADPDSFLPVRCDDLVSGSWASVAHADSVSNSLVFTNLSYATVEGTNHLIYVSATNSSAFFTVE
ncbi:hypothetical protein [Tichowtungia aerotolerans]|uniref:Uncharacterized protein n=1 Tax=Tichowtungia aerotolerans TaxID=2697043 RepID=A0A6P1M923_9BACT|nr:hypothetical protein [Tichowtungia aerotolerans]QHI70391.1 hypothetical protein GT409_13380 [Tichowtungia aerotolerans]